MFKIDATLIAITLKHICDPLTPYVTHRPTHKLYLNYTNMFYNSISVLATDESNCIAGNH
jgi:hypothetical protein